MPQPCPSRDVPLQRRPSPHIGKGARARGPAHLLGPSRSGPSRQAGANAPWTHTCPIVSSNCKAVRAAGRLISARRLAAHARPNLDDRARASPEVRNTKGTSHCSQLSRRGGGASSMGVHAAPRRGGPVMESSRWRPAQRGGQSSCGRRCRLRGRSRAPCSCIACSAFGLRSPRLPCEKGRAKPRLDCWLCPCSKSVPSGRAPIWPFGQSADIGAHTATSSPAAGSTRDLHRICAGSAWDQHGIFTGSARDLRRICTGSAPDLRRFSADSRGKRSCPRLHCSGGAARPGRGSLPADEEHLGRDEKHRGAHCKLLGSCRSAGAEPPQHRGSHASTCVQSFRCSHPGVCTSL